jgi:mono/diheme cytochrome c family protein
MTSWRTLVGSVALVVAGAVGVGACSSSEEPAAPSDPVLAEGQTVYNANCASCHGRSGNGGLGPKLSDRVAAEYPDIADQVAVIENGRGSMPKFEGRLTAEQIDAVARYTRESL